MTKMELTVVFSINESKRGFDDESFNQKMLNITKEELESMFSVDEYPEASIKDFEYREK